MYRGDFFTILIDWITTHYNSLVGISSAFLTSIGRSYLSKDGATGKHILIDGFVCACLTLSCTGLLRFFNLPNDLIIFIGALLGFIGAEQIRVYLLGFIVDKIKHNDKPNNRDTTDRED